MQIHQQARAILLTNTQEIALVRRSKNAYSSYWVAPGGWVEENDKSIEAALMREVHQETGVIAQMLKPLLFVEHILEEDVVVKQWFYLCLVDNPADLNTTHPDTPIQTFALNRDTLKALNIQPPKLKAFLLDNHDQLTVLPAVRY